VACGRDALVLCVACRGSLRPVSEPCCSLCGAPTAWPVARCRECAGRRLRFDSARAAVLYVGAVRPFMGAWKERGLRRAADLAAELVALRVPTPVADIVTPVPPDGVRQLVRGRHPAVELASALGDRWGIEHAQLLARTGGARRQTGLGRAARAGNVRGAFAARGAVPERVLLVDDVYTTGATASAAASALKRAGAVSVHVVTFARTVR
jgi:predicted amidophosphoribosyltransferase